MIYLINSSMMPQAGTYTMQKLNPQDWQTILMDAHENGNLASYIGYRQNSAIIQNETGITAQVTRQQLPTLEPGDTLLIMRLPYRLQDSKMKGRHLEANSLADFELFQARYTRPNFEII